MFRRKPARSPCFDSGDEEDSSTCLLSSAPDLQNNGPSTNRLKVSETYVVPDINGDFPTDLSDSDDDFFEKTCHYCGTTLSAVALCGCSDKVSDKQGNKLKERDQQGGKWTVEMSKPTLDSEGCTTVNSTLPSSNYTCNDKSNLQNINKPGSITRTNFTYSKEDIETLKRIQEMSIYKPS